MDIARFVADAPPGEMEAVQRDIESFTEQSAAVSRVLAKEIAAANIAGLRPVVVDGEPTVISKYNEIEAGLYHTAGGKRFKFDHVSGTVEPAAGEEEDPSPAARRLQVQIEKYSEDHYPSEEGAVAQVFDYEGDLVVVLVGRRLSPGNYHNGQWTSQFVVSGSDITGSIGVDVHFFEDGNVRLKSDTKVSSSGRNAIAAIEEAENSFEQELHKALRDLNTSEFKALRRALPVTRERVDWAQAANGYKFALELEGQ